MATMHNEQLVSHHVDAVENLGAVLVVDRHWRALRHRVGSILLGSLLRIARAIANSNAVDIYRRYKSRMMTLSSVARGAELDGVAVFLTPLDKAALEVGFGLKNLINREVAAVYIVNKQAVGKVVTLVQIYSAHHSFEGIAIYMLLCRVVGGVRDNMLVETYLRSYAVERLARHNLRAKLRHEALIAIGELDKEKIRCYTLDHGIAQKLEALVVDMATIFQLNRGRLMDKGQLVELYVVGNESKHIVDGSIELSILTKATAKGT